MCEKEQAQFSYHEPLPLLLYPNELIECATNYVKIETSATYGRHLVASKDIPAGSVIAIEKPFAKALAQEKFLTHCAHCLVPSYNLVRKLRVGISYSK